MDFTFAKRSILMAFLSLGCVASNGVAVADDTMQNTRAAYDAALKCFVANGNAEGERRDAGDHEGAARYDASGKRSFDAAVKLGQMLGLTNRQMNHDLDTAQAIELPKMVKDRDYFIDAVATCKGLGLM